MAESESDFRITKVNPYLHLTGELCGEYRENWPRYNGTPLYMANADTEIPIHLSYSSSSAISIPWEL